MSLVTRLAAACAAVVICTACGEKPAEQAPASAPAAQVPVKGPATSGTATLAGTVEVGVPECDQYLKKYFACVDSKVPEASRALMRQSVDTMKMAWKQAAATPQGKTGLAQACSQAEAQAKMSMAAYGCTW